jgi:hypothetical protein
VKIPVEAIPIDRIRALEAYEPLPFSGSGAGGGGAAGLGGAGAPVRSAITPP